MPAPSLPLAFESRPRPSGRLVGDLVEGFRDLSPAERLTLLRRSVQGRIVFTTSFGLEDQALTHWIFGSGLDIAVVTLDTGRLFPETYALWSETEQRYGKRIRGVYPRGEALEELVADQGIDGFYLSVEARKACCGVRKVEPLRRALGGVSAWVTGLRADQSTNRLGMELVSFDPSYGLIKANPLLDWSRDALFSFVKENGVPLNPLHERGFPSIGCAPCTRAIRPGEPERAGRWWWEDEARKECGLHVAEDGRLTRAAPQEAGA